VAQVRSRANKRGNPGRVVLLVREALYNREPAPL
jgi:hypothetical protein